MGGLQWNWITNRKRYIEIISSNRWLIRHVKVEKITTGNLRSHGKLFTSPWCVGDLQQSVNSNALDEKISDGENRDEDKPRSYSFLNAFF